MIAIPEPAPCADPEHGKFGDGKSPSLAATRISGQRFGIAGKICGRCYQRHNSRVRAGTEVQRPVEIRVDSKQPAPVVAAHRPRGRPPGKAKPKAAGVSPRRVLGIRNGRQQECRAKPLPPPPGPNPLLGPAPPRLVRSGSFDAMTPAQACRLIRRLWGTPAASAVLTRESETWKETDGYR